MKGFLAFLLVCVFVGMVGISTADIPDLVGNWTGPYVEYNAGQGFSEQEEGVYFINITEQQDRIIVGYSSYSKSDGTEERVDLAGVVSADGTEISLAEQNNGYSTGKIISADEFELTYLSDKDPISVAIDRFFRIN